MMYRKKDHLTIEVLHDMVIIENVALNEDALSIVIKICGKVGSQDIALNILERLNGKRISNIYKFLNTTSIPDIKRNLSLSSSTDRSKKYLNNNYEK